jgi:hypothetical protein
VKPETQYLIAFGLTFLPALAMLCLGLYLGERGRRLDAQRRERYGSAVKPTARQIPQPVDVEERVRNLGYDPTTVERGIKDLQDKAKEMGRRLSTDEARSMVLSMLHPDAMDAPQ